MADSFPTIMSIQLRPHDMNRNMNLPLHSITKYSLLYRAKAGYITDTFITLLKATHISYRCNYNEQHSSINKQLNTYNYFLDPGKSSIWQITHLKDESTNEIIADNLTLLVGFDRKSKQASPLNDSLRSICKQSMNIYHKRHNREYLDNKKRLVSEHISLLNKLKTHNLKKTSYVFRMKYQLRWSDEDTNKHLNATYCVRIVEDCCFEWNKNLRNSNNVYIESITTLFWSEMSVHRNEFCYPTIWYNDKNEYFYGTVGVINKTQFVNKIGFVFKLKSKNNANSKL
eukprot:433990_1